MTRRSERQGRETKGAAVRTPPSGGEAHPDDSGMLDVGDGQHLYWEEWGKPGAVPALYLHGGPGGTLGSSGYRHSLDLSRTRVIAFEQRGTGRSTPHASDPSTSLATNTTPHLIADIEALRRARGVEAWIVNGVSWGSTLALAYAQAHPERVLGVVLMAVTTTSRFEIDWITETVGTLYPEAWDRFAAFAEHADVGYRRGEGRIVEAYDALMSSDDAATRDAASWEWSRWEDAHISIGTGRREPHPRWHDDRYRIAFTRLAAHYWSRDGFCDPPLLERMSALQAIPAVLVHGRLDVSGPAVTPWRVQRAWGEAARLVIDDGEGHGGASMVASWRAANDEMLARILDGTGQG